MKNEDIFYCEKHSERAKAVLKALDGMSIEEARDMLDWCSGCLTKQVTIDWKRETERQARERSDKEEPAPETEAQGQAGVEAQALGAGETIVIKHS